MGEAKIMTVWPGIAATWIGRTLGRLYSIRAGVGFFTIGNLIAVFSIPLVVPLILGRFLVAVLREIPVLGLPFRILPNSVLFNVVHYTLTNRRVVIASGIKPVPERYVELDRFDTIDVVVHPGQAWYPAGDLIFRRGPVETFRLRGVMRPEAFRQACLKARQAYVGVRKALGEPVMV